MPAILHVSTHLNMPKLGKRTNLNVIFLVMGFNWQLHYIFALGPSPFRNFEMANRLNWQIT
jgi:hypothetical protein